MEQVFEIVISSCENCTWQGTLRAGGEAVPFQSELELLVELARLLPPEGLAAPCWKPRGSGAESGQTP